MKRENRGAAPRVGLLVALKLAIACMVTLDCSRGVSAQTALPPLSSDAQPQTSFFPGKNSGPFSFEKTWREHFAAQHQPDKKLGSTESFNRIDIITTNVVVVGDDKNIPPPANAGEIVSNLRDVIEHGDLADVQYYAEKFGVVLQGSDIGSFYHWGPVCGRVKVPTAGQFFNNLSTPWYFDKKRRFINSCGEYPYRKEFLPTGAIRVDGYIVLDATKVCITDDDIESAFRNMRHTHGPHDRKYNYSFNGINAITLDLFFAGTQGCVTTFGLFQNENTGDENE